MASLVDYISSQEALAKEARELMPYDPKECTFQQGSLRQELYACLTCYRSTGKLNNICYACSIKCHTSHDLVELFTKRGRTCDCGTSRIAGPCYVRYPKWSNLDTKEYSSDIPDSSNRYGHNFEGLFCDCNQPYNPLNDSNMVQCTLGVACDEDWYHEECIMGYKPGVFDRKPKNSGEDRLQELSEPGMDAETDARKDTSDNASDADEDDNLEVLPLIGFPSLDSFETIICWKCYAKCPELKDLETLLDCKSLEHIPNRKVLEDEEPQHKKTKVQYHKTLFLNSNYKDVLSDYVKSSSSDIKLTTFLKKHPYLYEEDPVFTLEEDEDDTSSVFELGVRQLNNIPADQAVQGLAAYDKIKSKLTEFLKPFAEDGRIVTEEEVKSFFTNIKK